MSATIPQSGWARAGLYIGLPVAVAATLGYFAWTSRGAPPLPPADAKQWGQGLVLPAPRPVPAIVAPPPAAPTPVVQTIAPAEPVVAPPAKVRLMAFSADDKQAMAEINQRAAERYADRMRPRTSPSATEQQAAANPDVLTPGGGSEYAQRMRATDFANTAPVPPDLPRSYTIRKNYRIPCLPDSPLSSEMVGPITCMTTQAVWSMDGHNILLPVGTEVHGTIERGLSNGEKRLFPIWTDMLTPEPYLQAIPLNAPSADELGRPGLPGDVNTHFWLKARDLALISVISMAGGVASSALSSGNGNTTLNLNSNGLQNGVESLAQAAFGKELSQADTLYRGQGQPIVVTVNKYINLSNYYRNVVLR